MTLFNKRLFIWVEGRDDERFFNAIIKPRFERSYQLVEVRPYANLKRQKLSNFIKSIEILSDDYIFVADIDTAPNVDAKKDDIHARLAIVARSRISIVIREIESWYLAGLDVGCLPVDIGAIRPTDEVDKEQFNLLIPEEFDSRIDFMMEILKCFSVDQARHLNRSFNYFIDGYRLSDSRISTDSV